jgi:hypothetical protein
MKLWNFVNSRPLSGEHRASLHKFAFMINGKKISIDRQDHTPENTIAKKGGGEKPSSQA